MINLVVRTGVFKNLMKFQDCMVQPLYLIMVPPKRFDHPVQVKAIYFDESEAKRQCVGDEEVFELTQKSDYRQILEYYDIDS